MPSIDTHRRYVFIDAAQLREKLGELGIDWRHAHLAEIAKMSVSLLNRDHKWLDTRAVLSRVFVYDAVGEIGDPDVEEWLKRNDEQAYVHVRRGALAGEGRRAGKSQKAVDVRLTVDALIWTDNRALDAAVLMTGDGDFAPLAEALRAKGIYVAVVAFREKLSELLATEADRLEYLPEDPVAWQAWTFPNVSGPS